MLKEKYLCSLSRSIEHQLHYHTQLSSAILKGMLETQKRCQQHSQLIHRYRCNRLRMVHDRYHHLEANFYLVHNLLSVLKYQNGSKYWLHKNELITNIIQGYLFNRGVSLARLFGKVKKKVKKSNKKSNKKVKKSHNFIVKIENSKSFVHQF